MWREGWPQWRTASEALPERADQLPSPLDGKDDGAADDGTLTDAETVRSATSPAAESAARSVPPGEARVQGRWDVGAARRGRLTRRTLAVALLLAISVVLIIALLLVAFGPSMFATRDQP